MVRCKITGCNHIRKTSPKTDKHQFWVLYQICKCCYLELIEYEPEFKLPPFETHWHLYTGSKCQEQRVAYKSRYKEMWG